MREGCRRGKEGERGEEWRAREVDECLDILHLSLVSTMLHYSLQATLKHLHL